MNIPKQIKLEEYDAEDVLRQTWQLSEAERALVRELNKRGNG